MNQILDDIYDEFWMNLWWIYNDDIYDDIYDEFIINKEESYLLNYLKILIKICWINYYLDVIMIKN